LSTKQFEETLYAIVGVALCGIVFFSIINLASPLIALTSSVKNRASIIPNDMLEFNATIIEWGEMYPQNNYTKALQIHNKSKLQFTMSYKTLDWNPSNIADYIILTWNYKQEIVKANEDLIIIFNLYVTDKAPQGEFSFSISITGIEVL
jgi:hypothetical protein